MISIRIETTLRLSDQSVLSALALDGDNVYVRKAATTRLTDKTSLLSVIKKYPTSRNSLLGGPRSYPTLQALLAKIVLFLNDPVIRSHAPGLETEFKISISTQEYKYRGDINARTVKGEKIRLTVRQTENVVGSWQWKTVFPPALFRAKPSLIAAHIDLDEFLSKIDSALGLTDEERAVLAKESPVEEVRDFFRKDGDQ